MADTRRITISAETDYDVVIGSGLVASVPGMVEGAGRVAIIHQGVVEPWVQGISSALAELGVEVLSILVPDGESAKSVEGLGSCWKKLGVAGFTRNDAVIGVGGGAATDLAGFVAATWLRGIRHVNVPTTVLGMVDAAVGGKTGINTEAGKNLVGAFHSPVGVICDLDTLSTLPRVDLVSGMAEVVKVGLTSDRSILADLRNDPVGCLDLGGELLADLIGRAVQVKADVVGADFREMASGGASGVLGREALNYGHTFGHAIERVEEYRWRHGDAVSVGLMYVAELARLGGYLTNAEVDTHREILQSLGLPTQYPAGHWLALFEAMKIDKKSRGSLLRFVILEGMGRPVIWAGPPEHLLCDAYEAVSG